jgi:hypothetical protein
MRIFTENVNFISTSGDKNILQIENYEEVFFDVYEISINGKKFISEKIGEYEKKPIVKIPVEIDGIKKEYPFILNEGKFQIVFNEQNELIQESVEENIPAITEEFDEVEEYSKESFEKELIDIQEKKNKILEYIENVKKTAKQQTDEYNKNQLKILEQQKEENKKELKSLLESSKQSWFEEFVDVSDKIKKELFDRLNINNSEIYESIDLKLEIISDDFKKLIEEDFSNTEKIFENKIKELITEIYNNQVIKVINDGIDKISQQSEVSFENIKNDFDLALSEKATSVDLKNVEDKLETEILSVQKESIELHDLISKSVSSNKKSITYIENKIDETQKELKENIIKIIDEKIEENEDSITTYYNEKLDVVENKLIDLSDENRQYFIGLINESRDNLLKEIKSIKENKAIEYIVENKKTGEKKEIDINSIKSDLQKEISNKISNEIISLRKYTAYHGGGGGTVAQQFADGGTMNGSLNINGQILSGGVDIATLFSGGGSADRLVNGSYQVLLSGNGDLTFPGGGYIGSQYGSSGWLVTPPNGTGGIASADGQQYIQINDGQGIFIGTNYPLSTHEWTFGRDGGLIFPDGSTQTTAFVNNLYEYATLNYLNSNFLNLSGGTITGDTRFNSNVTIFGNLTATGTTTFNNTVFSVTSALSVVHIGEGPAVWIGNSGLGDIASFNDIDTGLEVLHIGGSNGSFPNVGVKTSTPNKTLTVSGEISATSNITTSGKIYIQNDGNSDQWNTAYKLVSGSNLVYTESDQTISGVKTFNDLPLIPTIPISGSNPTSKEYVDTFVSSVSSSIQDSLLDIITNSASVFSLSSIYNNKVVLCTSTTSITVILPPSLLQGFNCMLIQLSSGQINIQGGSGVTVGSFGNLVKTAGQHAPVSIICLAPGIYNVSGNLI